MSAALKKPLMLGRDWYDSIAVRHEMPVAQSGTMLDRSRCSMLPELGQVKVQVARLKRCARDCH